MTTFTFDDAEVVANTNGGRTKDPNPFVEIIAQIALKKDDNGKPVAKRFVMTFEDEDAQTTGVNRARRQLSEAGKDNDPSVTVQVRDKVLSKGADGIQTAITFWTMPRMERKPRDTPQDGNDAPTTDGNETPATDAAPKTRRTRS